ncbi:MAG: hypothetical protein WC516_08570 [Patescibacteria group bacterium]|jgi:hypothetical protein
MEYSEESKKRIKSQMAAFNKLAVGDSKASKARKAKQDRLIKRRDEYIKRHKKQR